MKILIMIPAYNEAENIERVVDNLIENYPQYDYVIINDGSTDDTRKISARRGYNLLDLPVNVGLSGAIKSGMRYANYYGYDYVVQLDGDGQHDPMYINDLQECMERTGADIVIGSRFISGKTGWSMRMVGSRLIAAVIRLTTGARITDPTSGMRLFDRKMIEEFALNLNYGPEPDTVSFLIKQGARVAEVPVTIDERLEGESYLKPLTAVSYMTRMLLSILLIQNFRKR